MKKRSITSQITILIILFLTVGVCIAFMVNGWTTERHFVKANEERLAAETTVLSESLAVPLWTYNYDAVKNISEAFASHREVAFVTVTSNDSARPILEIRNPGSSETFISRKNIQFESEVIGFVEVGLGSETLRTRLKQSFTYTVYLVIVMTMIIIAGIRFSLTRLIEKPIATLADWARQIAHGNYLAADDGSMDTRELAPIAEQIKFMSGEIETRERKLNAHIALEETLGRIHQECIAFRKWDKANQELLQAAMSATKSRFGFLAELDIEADQEPVIALYAHPNITKSVDLETLRQLCASAINSPLPKFANDNDQLPEKIAGAAKKACMNSFLSIPLRWGGQTLGALVLGNRESGYDKEVIESLEPVARAAGSMIAASRDDRALRKSEDLNIAILEGALTGIFTVSLDGKILDLNPFALRMLGGEFEQVIHQNAVQLFIDDSEQQRVQDALVTVREHLESPLLGQPITITAKRLDGSTFPAELVVTLHKNREFLTGVIRDLSEQRASEQALRRAQKMEAIGQLTGGIAHDFTNILGIIIGNLEFLMRRNPSTANTQDHLQSAYKAAMRATELTRQLMNFTRKVPTAAKPVDLNMLIAGMDRLLGRSVTQQISLHYDLADDLWLINIDPGEFEDALLNLVINAKDAIDSGGNLTIATANRIVDGIQYKQKIPSIKPGDYVELSVSDTGKGIAENDIDRIFEPFFTTKAREKGTGLGLAMVFAFVERSGGHITVASTVGSGTVFSILLPRDIEPPESREDSLKPASEIPTGTQTILVVDDEPDLVRLAKMNLVGLGYSVVTAGNADEALKAMEDNKHIDLLFTDTVMPGSMNGRELADRAMRMHTGLKVLITTGYASGQDDVGETEIGKLPVLRKPYSRAELASCIREALDS